jgi:hypothetical protein
LFFPLPPLGGVGWGGGSVPLQLPKTLTFTPP